MTETGSANEQGGDPTISDVDPAEFFLPHPKIFDISHPGFSSALRIFCDQLWTYSVFTFLSSVFFPLRLQVAHRLCDSIFQPGLRIPAILTSSISALGLVTSAFREHQYATDFDLANSIRINSSFRNLAICAVSSLSYGFGVSVLNRHAEKYWNISERTLSLVCRGYGIPAILGLALPLCGFEMEVALRQFHSFLTDVIQLPPHLLWSSMAFLKPMTTTISAAQRCWKRRRACRFLNSQASADEPYTYDRLCEATRQYRLLKISVGIFSATCKLVTITGISSSKVAYEAVSWRWDGLEKPNMVLVNGRPLSITQRVSEIIRELTPFFGARYLWIDSICINQDDNDEKTSQIQLMSELYRGATRVIAYLGDAEDAALVPDFIGRLDSAALQRMDPTIFKQTDPLDRFPFSNEARNWTALQEFFRHPFWTRIWIIQEITLAKSVTLVYGRHRLQFDITSRVAQSFQTECPAVGGPILSMNNFFGRDRLACLHGRMNVSFLAVAREIYAKTQVVPMSQVLFHTRATEATDDRDRLYGLQALDPILRTAELRPDYDISVEEVYTNLARHSILNGLFSLFCLAGLDAHSTLDLPSWVPDLTSRPTKQAFHDSTCRYSVGGKISTKAKPETNAGSPRIIKLKGMILDRFWKIDRNNLWTAILALPDDEREDTLRGILRDGQGHDLRPGMRRWLDAVMEMVREGYGQLGMTSYKSGETLPEAVLRTMIADTDGARFPAPTTLIKFISRFLRFQLGLDWAQMEDREVEGHFTAEDNSKALALGNIWVKATTGRQFALTDTGYMCLGPDSIESRDSICVFLGSKVPYVIRRLKNDERYWQLVGECYVHGIMDGKSISPSLADTNMLEWIELQ